MKTNFLVTMNAYTTLEFGTKLSMIPRRRGKEDDPKQERREVVKSDLYFNKVFLAEKITINLISSSESLGSRKQEKIEKK